MNKTPLVRRSYTVRSDTAWSSSEGRVGIELGDVQDSNENEHVPIHVTCSVREFWIPIPDTDLDINVCLDGLDLNINLDSASYVAGSQIGRDAQPYTREISVTYEGSDKTETQSKAELSAGIESAKSQSVTAKIAGALRRDSTKARSQTRKSKYKTILTRVSYMTGGSWHFRATSDIDGKFYFDGTVISDIVCRIEGIGEKATVTAIATVPAENVHTNSIRNRMTSEPIDLMSFPNDIGNVRDDCLGTYMRNAKATLINIMLEKQKNSAKRDILIASHKIHFKKVDLE